MSPGPALSLRTQIAIAVISAALFLWFLPTLNAQIKSRMEPVPAPTTFALAVRCRLPTQHERVVVLVRDVGELPRGECMYVRSRGAYGVAK